MAAAAAGFFSLRDPGQSDGVRRRSLVLAAPMAPALLQPSLPAFADGMEPDPYSITLPNQRWKKKKGRGQAIRVRKETVYEASESRGSKDRGIVTISRTPLGADRSAADTRERLFELAGAFDRDAKKKLSKEDIVALMTSKFDDMASQRERGWLDVQRVPAATKEYEGPGGQRYVRFAYDARECSGSVFEFKKGDKVTNECDGEELPWRRHLLVVTVMPTKYISMRSDYLNGVPSGAMSKLLESMWLLDASAYVNSPGEPSPPDLEDIAQSFSVAIPVPDPEDSGSDS